VRHIRGNTLLLPKLGETYTGEGIRASSKRATTHQELMALFSLLNDGNCKRTTRGCNGMPVRKRI
jgi:hypothetical protein